MADPDVVSVHWSAEQAAAVSASARSDTRDAVLKRLTNARRHRDGGVRARLKTRAVAFVAKALEARDTSPDAAGALDALRAAALAHVRLTRAEAVVDPATFLANAKAATREKRARHLSGRAQGTLTAACVGAR